MSDTQAADELEALIQFLYLAPVGLVQASIDGEILFVNPLCAQLLLPLSRTGGLTNIFTALEGVAPELRHLSDRFGPAHGLVCEALRIQVNAGVRGKLDPQILSLTLLKLDSARLMAVVSDVTLQVKRERLLTKNEAWLNAILTGISDYAVVSLDGLGRVDDWNLSIGRVTGLTRDAVAGRPYSVFYPLESITPERVSDRLHEADENGWTIDEGWLLKSDGSRFWGSALIAPLSSRQDAGIQGRHGGNDPGDSAYSLVIRDINDKRETIAKLRKATSSDQLTGIANRHAFFQAAEHEMEHYKRSPRPLSLILIDADHFKSVNDTYGHAAGDAVLRDLAAAMTGAFRTIDIVARVGGEEFAVLLPSTGLNAALGVANRLRRTVESRPVQVEGAEIRYTISGGVATMDAAISGLDALMKRADQALYSAKAAGRNRIEPPPAAPSPA
jgi:diguanylate cyclase (GGDEF)-like protein/PAS domain S-box-containing protein